MKNSLDILIAELDRLLRGGAPWPRRSHQLAEIMQALEDWQPFLPERAAELGARMLGLLAQQLDRSVTQGEGDAPPRAGSKT